VPNWVDLHKVSDSELKRFYIVTTSWILSGDGDHDGYNVEYEDLACPAADLKEYLKSGAAFPDHLVRPPKAGRIRLADPS